MGAAREEDVIGIEGQPEFLAQAFSRRDQGRAVGHLVPEPVLVLRLGPALQGTYVLGQRQLLGVAGDEVGRGRISGVTADLGIHDRGQEPAHRMDDSADVACDLVRHCPDTLARTN